MAVAKAFATNAWPMNAWYPAAWNYEVKRQLSPRTICNKDLVLYRRTDGQVVALEDACWHRLLPLSLGHLKGDEVVCGYHGLVFNPAGRCTFMPAQETINPSACVRSFPAVEKYRLVWVWMGDPALADRRRSPISTGTATSPGSAKAEPSTASVRLSPRRRQPHGPDPRDLCPCRKHRRRSHTRNPFEVTHTDRKVTVTRWMETVEPPPFWARQLGKPGHVDRWQIIHFEAPVVAGDVGVALTGTGAHNGDRSQGVNGFFLAAITPKRRRAAIISGISSAASAPTTRA